jgi:hypothetical protein
MTASKAVRSILLLTMTCSALSARVAAGDQAEPIKGKVRLQTFDYRGVTLDGGLMRT